MIAPSGPAGGRRSGWRTVDGLVLLDKPAGASSTRALQRVRRLLRAAKAGHAGTLDPMATGMLPLCFGQATKACGQLLGSAKAYRATLRLGVATDTGDAEGQVLREAGWPELSGQCVAGTLAALVGTSAQVPPMHSALKQGGRPLYELARRGEQVARAARSVTVYRLELRRLAAPELEFEVVCSKGTYIRVLGEEIAARLGTLGHLVALRRLWVEPFENEAMITLDAIEDWAGRQVDAQGAPPWLQPVELAFARLPRLDLERAQARHLCQGRVVDAPQGTPMAPRARACDSEGRFLGLVEVDAHRKVRVLRLFVPGQTARDGGTA